MLLKRSQMAHTIYTSLVSLLPSETGAGELGGIIIIINSSSPSTCNLATRGTRLRLQTDVFSFSATSRASFLLSSMLSGCQPPRTKEEFISLSATYLDRQGGCTRDASINNPMFNCCWSLMKIWYCLAWPVFNCRDSGRIRPENCVGLGKRWLSYGRKHDGHKIKKITSYELALFDV